MVKRTLPTSIAYNLTRFKKIYCFVFVYVMLSFSYLPVYQGKDKMKREKKRCSRWSSKGKIKTKAMAATLARFVYFVNL